METSGEKLRRLRCARGWSQEALARYINVTTQSIYRWEQDEVVPCVNAGVRLAAALEQPSETWLGVEPFKLPEPPPRSARVIKNEKQRLSELFDGAA